MYYALINSKHEEEEEKNSPAREARWYSHHRLRAGSDTVGTHHSGVGIQTNLASSRQHGGRVCLSARSSAAANLGRHRHHRLCCARGTYRILLS